MMEMSHQGGRYKASFSHGLSLLGRFFIRMAFMRVVSHQGDFHDDDLSSGWS